MDTENFGHGNSQEAGKINLLPSHVLIHLFGLLNAKECALLACVQSSWRFLASDNSLWIKHCSKDWQLTLCEDGLPASSDYTFKDTYKVYKNSFGQYGPLYLRAKRCWEVLRNWTQEHLPPITESLEAGTTEEALDEVEATLHVSLPPAFRIVYRLCNGQGLHHDQMLDKDGRPEAHPSAFHGLLGGYSFYDHNINSRLLPLERILRWTQRLRLHIEHLTSSKLVLFAASFNLNKLFFINCNDGKIYVGTRDLLSGGNMMACVPDDDPTGMPKDGILRWLEEYGCRLTSGLYTVRPLNDWPQSHGICLFPEKSPACSMAITRGVQVRCSSVFVPEVSTLKEGDDEKHFFSYSVRMCLLAQPCVSESMSSCQLHARHWIIREGEEISSDIRGEAVVGKYPLLKVGEDEFVYQSCSGLQSLSGSIEGEFWFVPGSIRMPTGRSFEALVSKFSLEVPAFVY